MSPAVLCGGPARWRRGYRCPAGGNAILSTAAWTASCVLKGILGNRPHEQRLYRLWARTQQREELVADPSGQLGVGAHDANELSHWSSTCCEKRAMFPRNGTAAGFHSAGLFAGMDSMSCGRVYLSLHMQRSVFYVEHTVRQLMHASMSSSRPESATSSCVSRVNVHYRCSQRLLNTTVEAQRCGPSILYAAKQLEAGVLLEVSLRALHPGTPARHCGVRPLAPSST